MSKSAGSFISVLRLLLPIGKILVAELPSRCQQSGGSPGDLCSEGGDGAPITCGAEAKQSLKEALFVRPDPFQVHPRLLLVSQREFPGSAKGMTQLPLSHAEHMVSLTTQEG